MTEAKTSEKVTVVGAGPAGLMTAYRLLAGGIDTTNDGGIATLTLNRPQQMNALSPELRQALHRVRSLG